MTRLSAPYRAGDLIQILHSAKDGGTVLADLTVERITELATNGQFRVRALRHGYSTDERPTNQDAWVEVIVDRTGRDRHGYAKPARSVA